VSAQLFVGTWLPGTDIYLLWADDNGATNPDGGYTIDNFQVNSLVVTNVFIPLSVTLTAPADTQIFAGPAPVTLSANAFGSIPPTDVTFFTNGVSAGTDTTSPFSVSVVLPIGTHTVQAVANNGAEQPSSQTITVTIRDEFVHLTSPTFTENFDAALAVTPTNTPNGWYVGYAPYSGSGGDNIMAISVGDGTTGPNGSAGWNYGTTGDADRALGTAPTGTGSPAGDRGIVVRIKNDTGQSITAFDLIYTGEVWRNYVAPNAPFGYTNMVSLNNGATWVETGTAFNFIQPATVPTDVVGARNGNDPANQQTLIGSTFTLPSPVPPNGTLYIRWFDRNEGGTDGGIAIDDVEFTATLEAFTPEVTFITPTNGQQVGGGAAVVLTAQPSMANPVTNITFYDNNLSTVIGSDTNSPFSITASNLTLGAHTLYAVAQDSGGIRATGNVSITINPNVAPSLIFTNPPVITDYLVGTEVVNISVDATDTDGSIVRVEFFVNDLLWATDTNNPYGFDLNNIYAGVNTIRAVAQDNAGARTTNSIVITATNYVGVTAIITNGSQWFFNDAQVSLDGTGWQTSTDNTGWSTGFGEFGAGDAGSGGRPERTVVNQGPSGSRYAVYFRKTINVANPSSFTSLPLAVLADDAAVVYINGTEVFRSTNLLANPVVFTSLAIDDAADDGTVYTITNLPTSVLQAGNNIIAVELHQNSVTSSDLSFDLMLGGTTGAVTGPKLTIARTSSTQATISWGADATGLTLYGGPTVPYSSATWSAIGGVITGAGSTVVSTTSGNQYFMLRSQP
jgi:hypothetical protein